MSTAALADGILTPGEGQVRALICVGGNPLLAFPDQQKTWEVFWEISRRLGLRLELFPAGLAEELQAAAAAMAKSASDHTHLLSRRLKYAHNFTGFEPSLLARLTRTGRGHRRPGASARQQHQPPDRQSMADGEVPRHAPTEQHTGDREQTGGRTGGIHGMTEKKPFRFSLQSFNTESPAARRADECGHTGHPI
jgi:hypothetical protein